ncbi:hypothetical protein [Chryseobacterium sp.]|uniref:hypothetical protein n=1 Tax=Chryseobacterium sp. TaxID=1871047 RepID=UPI002FC5A81A
MKIIIKSWKPGFKKVIFTQLQMDLLGMSLKDAKSNVDKILDDKEVVLVINDKILFQKFIKEMDDIGLIFQNNL